MYTQNTVSAVCAHNRQLKLYVHTKHINVCAHNRQLKLYVHTKHIKCCMCTQQTVKAVCTHKTH